MLARLVLGFVLIVVVVIAGPPLFYAIAPDPAPELPLPRRPTTASELLLSPDVRLPDRR